jgi:hydroxymethylglutaryl-CoA reductase
MGHAENMASLSLGSRVYRTTEVVACVFVAGEMRLSSRCLANSVYSDFAIPAFGRHVTVRIYQYTRLIISP